MALTSSTRVRCSRRDFFAADIDGELVMLDAAEGKYYTLNTTGRAIWEMLGTPDSGGIALANIIEGLVSRFDASQDLIEAEVQVLMAELHGKGLIEIC